MIRAIETEYAGYRFRSRLEARWAVYFDVLGVKWDYELEGFELPSGRYLPDFFLHICGGTWAEVKPVDLSSREMARCKELCQATNRPVFLLVGVPALKLYDFWNAVGDEPFIDDVALTEEYFEEDRFFMSTGDGEYNFSYYPQAIEAVNAARAARFEKFRSEPSRVVTYDPGTGNPVKRYRVGRSV